MKVAAGIILFVLASAPGPVSAQKIVDNGIDDRIEALNAVLAFRTDLHRDSTVIAACRLPTIDTAGRVPGLQERFHALLAQPDTVQRGEMSGCPVHGFADARRRVLWLDTLLEIKKTPAPGGFLPEFRRIQYEITFQLLAGPGYREFQRYLVEPTGINRAPDNSGDIFSGWRVAEYKLLGWDFHWGDDLGHGSGVRLP